MYFYLCIIIIKELHFIQFLLQTNGMVLVFLLRNGKSAIQYRYNPCFTYLRKSCFKNPVLGPENPSLDLDAKKFDFIHTLFFFFIQ